MLLKQVFYIFFKTIIPKQHNSKIFFYLTLLFILNIIIQFSANDGNYKTLYNNFLISFISLLLYLLLNKQKYHWFIKISLPLYITSILLLLMIFLFGHNVNGSQRWLDLGFKIQPSELTKISLPLFTASFLHQRSNNGFNSLKNIDYLLAIILILIPTGLILKQPDLGTAILVFLSGFLVLIYGGLPKKFLIYGLLILTISSPFIWYHLKDYQKYRVITMLHPEQDARGKGYHVTQGKIAIGSGGWFGKGYMQGSQVHLHFIPEKNTDFIMAVLAEEFGLTGVFTLLLIYFLLLREFLLIAENSEQPLYQALVLGITMSISCDIFINIGMVAGLLPVVGVPLPFISHAGTSTIINIISVATISSIGLKNIK